MTNQNIKWSVGPIKEHAEGTPSHVEPENYADDGNASQTRTFPETAGAFDLDPLADPAEHAHPVPIDPVAERHAYEELLGFLKDNPEDDIKFEGLSEAQLRSLNAKETD